MATEPGWLRAWADASAVLLMLEVCFALLITTALVFLLAFGARWLRVHVAPLLNAATPRARQALRMADAGTARVVRGVAEVYGIRQAAEAGLRALWRGTLVDVLAQGAPSATDAATTPTEAPAPAAAEEATAPPPAATTSVPPAGTPSTSRQAPDWQRPSAPPREPRQPAGGRDTGGMGAHAG
jgi:hypothetical protein